MRSENSTECLVSLSPANREDKITKVVTTVCFQRGATVPSSPVQRRNGAHISPQPRW